MSTKANIYIEAGTDFNVPITLTDSNDEDLVVTVANADVYTASAVMAKYYGALTSYDFDCALANGTLTMSMSRTVTTDLTPGRYVYLVNLTSLEANVVSRPVEGVVTVTPKV